MSLDSTAGLKFKYIIFAILRTEDFTVKTALDNSITPQHNMTQNNKIYSLDNLNCMWPTGHVCNFKIMPIHYICYISLSQLCTAS